MSLDNAKNLNLDGSQCAFAVVASRYNGELVDALLSDVLDTFSKCGVSEDSVRVVRVPGASEIPVVASVLASTRNYDAVVALGVVIAGDTPHHDIIGRSTADALQRVAVDSGIPVVNGIIVANTRAQAEARTTGSIRRGREFAECAVDMAGVCFDVLEEYMLSRASDGDDEMEIDDGFEVLDSGFGGGLPDEFDDIESGGAVVLPEDEIYDKSAQKKRAVKRSRKPRKG